jgi:ABC-2 type transport system permease protein
MFGNVFLKSIYDQRRALLGWAVGIILLVALMIAMWPSVRDMPKLDEFLASYPKAMRELFNSRIMRPAPDT